MSISELITGEAGHLLEEFSEFEHEIQVILQYAESRWPDNPRHFPYTSYGFVMVAFSKIDLYGQYWFPAQNGQNERMLSFLTEYLKYPRKESEIAIHLWRHNLMHSSEMRPMLDTRDNKSYLWLFHYRLRNEHMQIRDRENQRILSLGLFDLVEDLRAGLTRAIEELPNLTNVLKKWPATSTKLSTFPRT